MIGRIVLGLWFLLALGAMTAGTIEASLDRSIVAAWSDLWPDPWFRVTLLDAELAFLAVWLWVAWREARWWKAAIWLVAFVGLGNFAISVYALLRLWKTRSDGSLRAVLLRDDPSPAVLA